MNREDIIKLAQEAGFEIDCCSLEWHDRIERFFQAAYAAGAEAERDWVINHLNTKFRFTSPQIVSAIRARGQA